MSREVRKSKSPKSLPARRRDMPATVGLVEEVREEVLSEVRALEHRMDSRFNQLDSKFEQIDSRFEQMEARFEQIDARFEQIDARFEQIDARFEQMEARFERIDSRFSDHESRFDRVEAKIDQVLAVVHRTQAIVEQQHSENRIMLEALHGITQRMDRIESRQDATDQTLRALASRKKLN